jgi:hypothetical protein
MAEHRETFLPQDELIWYVCYISSQSNMSRLHSYLKIDKFRINYGCKDTAAIYAIIEYDNNVQNAVKIFIYANENLREDITSQVRTLADINRIANHTWDEWYQNKVDSGEDTEEYQQLFEVLTSENLFLKYEEGRYFKLDTNFSKSIINIILQQLAGSFEPDIDCNGREDVISLETIPDGLGMRLDVDKQGRPIEDQECYNVNSLVRLPEPKKSPISRRLLNDVDLQRIYGFQNTQRRGGKNKNKK